jgi:hypothetical protein
MLVLDNQLFDEEDLKHAHNQGKDFHSKHVAPELLLDHPLLEPKPYSITDRATQIFGR